MRCEEIMKRDVQCITGETSAAEAARLMKDENVGFLPVCQANQKVIGTLTDRDLAIRLVASEKSGSTPVREIMSKEVIACRPEDDLLRVTELMAENRKSRVGSSRVDLQACKLEYSIVSPK